jgi:hypothetical protein
LVVRGRLRADEPPPDISDLRVDYTRPPEADNGYALLSKLTASLPSAPNENSPEERHFARIFENKVAWNREIVAGVLGRYPPTLVDSVRRALEAPEFEAPEVQSYEDAQPEIGRFRSLAQILTQQARLAWENQDHAKATELNLLVLKLGSLISQSRGPLITVLSGTAIETIAFGSIQKHADADSITPESLRHYLTQLGHYEIRPDDYHIAYKLETVVFANTLKSLKGSDLMSLAGGKKTPWASAAMLPGLWQPNRTVGWHADFIRAAISETPSELSSGPSAASARLMEHIDGVPWPRRAQNITGRILLAIVAPVLGKLNITCHRARASTRLTQIYAALRLYHREHQGALPSSLDELVPGYLPAVPLDPFDDKPLRYSQELSTIWSTGPERQTITSAEGDLPKSTAAYRLIFARPSEPLPSFTEYEAQDSEPDNSGEAPGDSAPSDVSPSK